MVRFQNFDEVYTALYVDFDSTYLRLAEQDQALARIFAIYPQRWLRWLESHAIRMMYGDNVRRRIVKKHCYINPQRHTEFKTYFIRSGFQVTECPVLSNTGKTNATVCMTMDCLDALKSDTRYDEFIVLSSDADLTPVLLRIQEHARRTLMLAVGYINPLYASSCSWRIREDWFLTQALEDSRLEAGDGSIDRHADGNGEGRYEGKPVDKESASSTRSKGVFFSLPASKRTLLSEAIRLIVAESNVPVPFPSVAQMLQHEQEVPPDWFGAGTLKELLVALDIAPLRLSFTGHGFVFDPSRHDSPDFTGGDNSFECSQPELHKFAAEVHHATGIPLLAPSHFSRLFVLLAEHIKGSNFSKSKLINVLEDRCDEEGLPVNENHLAFLLDSLTEDGFAIVRDTELTPLKLATVFFNKALELCEDSFEIFPKEKQQLLAEWLLG